MLYLDWTPQFETERLNLKQYISQGADHKWSEQAWRCPCVVWQKFSRKYLQFRRQQVVLCDCFWNWSRCCDIHWETAHKLLPGQVKPLFKPFPIHLDILRSWTGSLEENQDAITDLHTDSIFATPAFEVILSQNHNHLSCEGVEIPQQSCSGLLLSPGLPLQRLHLWGRIRRSKHQQRIRGTCRRHSLHLQERWCFSGVAQYGTGQDYQRDGRGMGHLCQKPKGIFSLGLL